MTASLTEYHGFEQGPIRPPSEAGSLFVRVSRNCPWNRCTFCPVYKGSSFSLRPVAHVLEDIRRVARYVRAIRDCGRTAGKIYPEDVLRLTEEQDTDRAALNAALHWARNGMRSIFIQDANSLIIKPDRLLEILRYLSDCFPWVERITSYARSHTIARIADEDLQQMRQAGLSRVHIGMESGADSVLALVKKGVDKATHVKAGLKVKKAGMELSEYLMPGLGGRIYSQEHALESADALNQINPDFIRLRTLAIPDHVELFQDSRSGGFSKLTDYETAQELLLFLKSLHDISSYLKSDHILNLFEDLNGRYPEDKDRLVSMVQTFLELPPHDRMLYQVGRRMAMFRGLTDLDQPGQRPRVEEMCSRMGITPENVDQVVDELMKRFI